MAVLRTQTNIRGIWNGCTNVADADDGVDWRLVVMVVVVGYSDKMCVPVASATAAAAEQRKFLHAWWFPRNERCRMLLSLPIPFSFQ